MHEREQFILRSTYTYHVPSLQPRQATPNPQPQLGDNLNFISDLVGKPAHTWTPQTTLRHVKDKPVKPAQAGVGVLGGFGVYKAPRIKAPKSLHGSTGMSLHSWTSLSGCLPSTQAENSNCHTAHRRCGHPGRLKTLNSEPSLPSPVKLELHPESGLPGANLQERSRIQQSPCRVGLV